MSFLKEYFKPLVIVLSVTLIVLFAVICAFLITDRLLPFYIPGSQVGGDSSEDVTLGEVKPLNEIELIFAGSFELTPSLLADATSEGSNGALEYSFDNMINGLISRVTAADMSFVCFDLPITEKLPSAGGKKNAPREMYDILSSTGFDVFNVAGYHMSDMNAADFDGQKQTLDFYKSEKASIIGAYESMDAYGKPTVIEVRGVKIALLAYTDSTLGNATLGNTVVPYFERGAVYSQVMAANDEADVTVVFYNWSNGGERELDDEISENFKYIADLGADIIIGNGVSKLLPIEISGADCDKCVCVYSLGSLVSAEIEYTDNLSGLLSVKISADRDKGIGVSSCEFIPTVSHYTTDTTSFGEDRLFVRREMTVYYLENYTEELARVHGAHSFTSTGFTLNDLKKLANTIMIYKDRSSLGKY